MPSWGDDMLEVSSEILHSDLLQPAHIIGEETKAKMTDPNHIESSE